MRSTINLRVGNGRSFIPTSHVNHEPIDIVGKYPAFNKILTTNDVKLIDISNLQVETEKIMCCLAMRMFHLSSPIDGKSMAIVNGFPSDNNGQIKSGGNGQNSVNLPAIFDGNIDQMTGASNCLSIDNNRHGNNNLIVKSSPEKPLAFIIAQNRPSTRRSSITAANSNATVTTTNNNKRKLNSKIDLSINTNCNNQSDNKRRKPNEFLSTTDATTTTTTNKKNKKNPSGAGNNVTTQNYEIPNKFWELMEPYCAEINEENVKTLEAMMRAYEGDSVYYEVPEIVVGEGRDGRENQTATTPTTHLNGFVEGKNGVDLSNLLKKIDLEIRKPLTQSKALKEFPLKFVDNLSKETENFIKSHQTKLKESKLVSNNGFSKSIQSSKSMAKQLKVSNSFKLERHIKKTVDDLGICNFNLPFIPKAKPDLDLNESGECQGIAKSSEADIIDPQILDASDYIELSLPQPLSQSASPRKKQRKLELQLQREDKALLGLSRRQAELKLVSESNLGMLRRLMVAAKRDTKRQEIERRLAVADADVIECYNIIESYRPTHKVPLKKDRDAAYKALKERKKILKELDNLDTEFL